MKQNGFVYNVEAYLHFHFKKIFFRILRNQSKTNMFTMQANTTHKYKILCRNVQEAEKL